MIEPEAIPFRFECFAKDKLLIKHPVHKTAPREIFIVIGEKSLFVIMEAINKKPAPIHRKPIRKDFRNCSNHLRVNIRILLTSFFGNLYDTPIRNMKKAVTKSFVTAMFYSSSSFLLLLFPPFFSAFSSALAASRAAFSSAALALAVSFV